LLVTCPEHTRLRQEYETALRQWGHVLYSRISHSVDIEVRQKVFDKRNAARERLNAHALSCPACNSKLKRIS
jgi:hypothetical protein